MSKYTRESGFVFLLAIGLLLGSFGCLYIAARNLLGKPGRGLAMLAAGVVMFGAAWGLFHQLGVEGF